MLQYLALHYPLLVFKLHCACIQVALCFFDDVFLMQAVVAIFAPTYKCKTQTRNKRVSSRARADSAGGGVSRNSIKENLENYKALLQCVAPSIVPFFILLTPSKTGGGFLSDKIPTTLAITAGDYPFSFLAFLAFQKRGGWKRMSSHGYPAEDNLR